MFSHMAARKSIVFLFFWFVDSSVLTDGSFYVFKTELVVGYDGFPIFEDVRMSVAIRQIDGVTVPAEKKN